MVDFLFSIFLLHFVAVNSQTCFKEKNVTASFVKPSFTTVCSNEFFDKHNRLSVYVVNLNENPELRWNHIIQDKKIQLLEFTDAILSEENAFFGAENFAEYLPYMTRSLPKSYYDELVGISTSTGIPVGDIVAYNLFCEMHLEVGMSVIAATDHFTYHGTNLDFGSHLRLNMEDKTRMKTELMQPLLVQINFELSGKPVYSAVSFVGCIGVITGVKKKQFSLATNGRASHGLPLMEWIQRRVNRKWDGIVGREVLKYATSYAHAERMLDPTLLTSSFILTGNNQSRIIIPEQNSDYIHNFESFIELPKSWYQVRTSYDRQMKGLIGIQDRFTTAIKCVKSFGDELNITNLIYNIFSASPICSKLTVYTTIFEIHDGSLWSWKRTSRKNTIRHGYRKRKSY